MTKFFPYKTNTNTAFDIARGALGNAKNALVGAPISAYLGSSVLATSSLATAVGACALGGAILIVPLMIAHKRLAYAKVRNHNYSLDFDYDYDYDEEARRDRFNAQLMFGLQQWFAFGSACIGAALCGLAVLAVAQAALIGSLILTILPILLNKLQDLDNHLSPRHLRWTAPGALEAEEADNMRIAIALGPF